MNRSRQISILNFVLIIFLLGWAPRSTQNEFPAQYNLSSLITPSNSSAEISNRCSDSLFPVQLGASWTYTNTSDTIGNSNFTNSITAVRSDGFTITSRAGNATSIQNWSCTSNGLVALSTDNEATTPGLSIQGLSLTDLTVSHVTGLTLPFTIQPNMQWPYDLNVSGTFILPGNQTITANGTVSTILQASDMETITVPAGTFTAQKVQTNSTFHISGSYHGISIPLTALGKATIWLAPGVGWIRSEETGQFVGTTYNSTTELQSYSIP